MSKQIEENHEKKIPLAENDEQALDQSASHQELPQSPSKEGETAGDEKGKKGRGARKRGKKRSLIGRFFTWLLSSILMLFTAIVLLLFFLVDTQAGLRTLTAAANRYASDYISIGDAKGRLGQSFQLNDLTLKLPNYQPLKIESLSLAWDYVALLDKRVDLKSIQVTGADLNFTPLVPEPEKESSEPFSPLSIKEIDIPINLSLDSLDFAGSTLQIGDFYLGLNQFQIDDLALVENRVTLKHALGDLHVLVGDSVDLPFIVALNGDIDIPKEGVDLNLALYAQDGIVNDEHFNVALNSQLDGELNDLSFNVDGRVDWSNMLNDPILLKLENNLLAQNKISTYLHIKNLANQIMAESVWQIDQPYDFDLTMKMNAPYLSQFHPNIRGSMIGDLCLQGDLMKPLLNADVRVEKLDILGLRLNLLTLMGSHKENHQAKVALLLDQVKFNEFYLKHLGIDLDGTLTEEFTFDILIEDLERELVAQAEESAYNEVNIDKVTATGSKEEIFYAENMPISFSPKGATEVLIKNVEYRVQGRAESHQFNFLLDSIGGMIHSNGVAALQNVTTDPTFDLYLGESKISSPFVGDFELNRPAYFHLGVKDQQVKLSPVCYQQGYVVLCAEGERTKEGVNTAVVTLNNLPSSLLKDYLPDNISINTKANVTIAGQFSDEEDFIGVTNVSLSKGDIRYRLQGREVEIPLSTTLLDIQARPSGITSTLNVDWGKYLRVVGDGKVDDLFKENRVAAKVKADVPSLNWISPLVPALQGLGGEILLTSEVNGPLAHPEIGANLSVKDGRLYIASLNSRLKNINLNVNLQKGTPVFLIKGGVGTDKGALQLDGVYNISNLTASLNVKGNDLLLANSEDIKLIISPQLSFNALGKPGGGRYRLTGTVKIPELVYQHKDSGGGGSVVTVSSDTVIIGDGNEHKRSESFMNNLYMDVSFILGDRILVGAEGLTATLNGGVKVTKAYGQTIRGLGVINIGKGEFDIYGQLLTLDKGKIQFSGASITNPTLDIQASRSFVNEIEGREVQVGVKVLGSAEAPRIELYSSPMLTDIEIASYLFLGRSPNLQSPTENLMLLNMVRKIAMGEPISGSKNGLASQLGLSDFGFMETPDGSIGVGIGKRFANSFYVGLGVGVEDSEGAFAILRYRFLKYFNVNTAIMSEGGSINVNYLRDF
ncbi:translocation/assembly module TamB domain-containing protein [Ignatzschineria cameli]|uniref:translocation/assembly module TamB domain-containing protein n=1 Tax=Ignatzschineria cameli TaxID=2182793 RepID=UPI000D61F131|nr:translocation/assembly module TamB domain-containing protein [Ignatzschineria cameli]PWD87323.1 hypothetical protein DC080_00410 [Ignatzschineria cameli]